MLTNPLYYFFVKNGQLRCRYSFPYKNGKSFLLSPQTIPSFLRYYFGMEGRRTPERDAFFTALRDYIDCFYQPEFSADLYTKLNKSFLIRFFRCLFWSELCRLSFQPDPKAPSELPSLNQICRNTLLWELYDQQAKGASLLLLRDLFPSDSKYAATRALVYGKPLTLTCPWLPDQTFRNHMHLLLFSSEKGEAAYLRRALNAQLIDLAGRERNCSDLPPPSDADCAWLRTQGVLYGLMLNNGYKLPRPKAEPKPSMVEAFFTKHCFFHPLSYCDGRSMYAAYVDYYRVLRDGRNPPIGKIQFIKEARELIENGTLGKVKYKKCRRPKDTPPRWYFLGVDRPIRETPPQPPTVIDERVRRIHEMVIPPLNHNLSFPEVKIVTVPSL